MNLDLHVRRHTVDARLDLAADDTVVTAVFGPSGAGKTTLLRALAGLHASGGHLRVDGEVWDDGAVRVPAHRRNVGYVTQSPALFPHLDVARNVAFGLAAVPRAERELRVRAALASVGVAELAGRRTADLSGGEAQRVALARALAPRPRLLLLDEPLSALDTPTRLQLQSDLRRTLVAQHVPTVLVTHDRTEAIALADRLVVLVAGRVRQVGTPADVFARPADADVARAVGVETVVPGVVRDLADGLVSVAVGEREVLSAGEAAHGERVLVCVRAEDVALEAVEGVVGSARNRLRGVVTDVVETMPLYRVELDVGFRLIAAVTRPAVQDLGLSPGVEVAAVVKAPAVHLVRRAV